jgi:hypothetical protein
MLKSGAPQAAIVSKKFHRMRNVKKNGWNGNFQRQHGKLLREKNYIIGEELRCFSEKTMIGRPLSRTLK